MRDIKKQREAQRRYAREHAEKYKRASRDRRSKARKLIQELKSVPCMDCGIQYPHYVMDFDHVRGEKKFDIATNTSKGVEAILDEIAKCDVVCANCHRHRTAMRLMK